MSVHDLLDYWQQGTPVEVDGVRWFIRGLDLNIEHNFIPGEANPKTGKADVKVRLVNYYWFGTRTVEARLTSSGRLEIFADYGAEVLK